MKPEDKTFSISGAQGANRLVPMLRELSALYGRGAKSKIDLLDLVNLEVPGGGRLRLTMTDVPPESLKRLGELLEVLAGAVQKGAQTVATLEIRDADETCPLVKRLKEGA